MKYLKTLMKLVPPPDEPVEVGSASEWVRVEKQLGLKLPKDYKAFIEHYGTGEFANFYCVFNPFTTCSSNLLENFKQRGANYSERREDDPENYPLPMFPELPGILPWGSDSNGHTYFWLVTNPKKPDDWTVVWDDLDGPEGFEENDYTFSSYLLGVLQGEIDALAGNYPGDDDFVFKPSSVGSSDPRVEELSAAIAAGDTAKVKKLAKAGVDMNAVPTDGFHPTITASQHGSKMIQLVLKLGADPKKGQSDENSPLAGPVYGNDYEGVQALIAAGADLNHTFGRWGHNALRAYPFTEPWECKHS